MIDPRSPAVPFPTDPLANPSPVPDHAPKELPAREFERQDPEQKDDPSGPTQKHPLGPPEPVE
jgi:hypothetical protein